MGAGAAESSYFGPQAGGKERTLGMTCVFGNLEASLPHDTLSEARPPILILPTCETVQAILIQTTTELKVEQSTYIYAH